MIFFTQVQELKKNALETNVSPTANPELPIVDQMAGTHCVDQDSFKIS